MQRPSIVEYLAEEAHQQGARNLLASPSWRHLHSDDSPIRRQPSSRPLMPLKTCNALDSYIALQCLLTP